MSTAQRPGPGPARALSGVRSSFPTATATRSWSAADAYSEAVLTGRGPLYLRRNDGWLLPMEVERWCAEADATDLALLRRSEGAVLDVGCGPGRLVAALAGQGRRALGIDVSEAAVARTRRLGAQALHRSVFDPLPAEGRWDTALLIDGNIGIGGDPRALLLRLGRLVGVGGLLLVETTPADVDERVSVRITPATKAPDTETAPFPWARLGTPALLRHAARAGWRATDQWTDGERCFVALRSRTTRSSAEPPNSTAVVSSQRDANPSGDRPAADR